MLALLDLFSNCPRPVLLFYMGVKVVRWRGSTYRQGTSFPPRWCLWRHAASALRQAMTPHVEKLTLNRAAR